jgi:hypothetical protein
MIVMENIETPPDVSRGQIENEIDTGMGTDRKSSKQNNQKFTHQQPLLSIHIQILA